MKKGYWRQLRIAVDQLGTALVGGWADETLSSYAWRLERQGKWWGRFWRPRIDRLFLTLRGETYHCSNAYEAERTRGQMPPELRDDPGRQKGPA